MANTILIYKCKHCGDWNHLENDPECQCGHILHEPGDPHATEDTTAEKVVNLSLNKVADLMGL